MPSKIRSLLNVAILTAPNRPHELKLHIRRALRNGCTREEVREVLLHAAAYYGVPAAVDAVRSAKEAFAALDEESAANPAA